MTGGRARRSSWIASLSFTSTAASVALVATNPIFAAMFGTLLGAYLISLVNNLLNFLDVSKHYQLVAQALIIILAVSVYVERRRTA